MTLKLQAGAKLVLATHNPGKARELSEILGDRFALATLEELGLPVPEETEETFAGNALLKARAAAQATGMVALADDSGLSVTALDGAPGVHSARWALPNNDFGLAAYKIHARLIEQEETDFSAWFTCALAVAWPDGEEAVFEGEVHGVTIFPGRGDKGFGYDPHFIPSGYDLTFGEMEPAQKDAISHRALAFEKLKAALL